MTSEKPSYFIDPAHVLWKEKDELVTVLLLADGSFFELNTLGSRVWKLLAEEKSPDAIIATLTPLYDVLPETLASDVSIFIAQMLSHGLLQRHA